MCHQEKTMVRKKKKFALKLIAACFIALMLLRTNWLTSLFINSSQSEGRTWNLPKDIIHKSQGRKSILREMLVEKEGNVMEDLECPNPKLDSRKVNETRIAADCKRIQPFKSSCTLANILFGDPSTLDITGACKSQFTREFCKITGSPDAWSVHCDVLLCDKNLYIGKADDNGKFTWYSESSNHGLEKSIEHIIRTSYTRYCFLSCAEMSPDEREQGEGYTFTERGKPQLLILPPMSSKLHSKVDNEKRKYLNLNFIFIDSVSRHHFYRSLPRTVKVIESMGAEHKDKDLMVLDFELVQGVRLRTFENLQALFSGSINPFEIPFGTQEMPRQKLDLQKLLVPLRHLGFSNLWIEDLCPLWEWGLSKDLLVYNKSLSEDVLYKNFIKASKRAGIDDLGTTFTSCDILNANDVPDPFHAPDKICYNGKHQHEYMLSYLKMFHETMLYNSKPFMSFLETNIGHIGSGRRIQYLDTALAEYLDWSKTMTDTLTVVFSDHGNSYGDFVSNSPDGRVEIYHPVLFMIIPDKVQSFFSKGQLQALINNQHRLISILDLHYTLMYIIKILHTKSESEFDITVNDFNKQFNVSKYGLLTDISPSRTCSHLPRIMPNLCICEGYDYTDKNKAYNLIVAIYFLGMMNNRIQKQRQESKTVEKFHGGFRNCQRMKVKKLKNIKESKLDDLSKISKMDLYVKTDRQKVDEIFFISIHITKDSKFALGNFDRITPYGKYANCSDIGVDLKLCICDGKNEDRHKTAYNAEKVEDVLESILYKNLKSNITSVSIHGTECLYIITQSNKEGIVYESFSNCEMRLVLKLTFTAVNLVLSTADHIHVIIMPGDITFLTAGVSTIKNSWSCDISIEVSI